MRFWIVLATLVLIALGFTLVITNVNLGLQEVGSMSITTGLLMALVLMITTEQRV